MSLDEDELRVIEALLKAGLVKEVYDEKLGVNVYVLTEKGEEWLASEVVRSPDAFDALLAMVIKRADAAGRGIDTILEFLLSFIYTYVYGLDPDDARRRARSWLD